MLKHLWVHQEKPCTIHAIIEKGFEHEFGDRKDTRHQHAPGCAIYLSLLMVWADTELSWLMNESLNTPIRDNESFTQSTIIPLGCRLVEIKTCHRWKIPNQTLPFDRDLPTAPTREWTDFCLIDHWIIHCNQSLSRHVFELRRTLSEVANGEDTSIAFTTERN